MSCGCNAAYDEAAFNEVTEQAPASSDAGIAGNSLVSDVAQKGKSETDEEVRARLGAEKLVDTQDRGWNTIGDIWNAVAALNTDDERDALFFDVSNTSTFRATSKDPKQQTAYNFLSKVVTPGTEHEVQPSFHAIPVLAEQLIIRFAGLHESDATMIALQWMSDYHKQWLGYARTLGA